MPDPVSRKRLKKRMLDRWENEGGRIANDTASVDETKRTSENKSQSKKLSSAKDNSTNVRSASTKSRQPTRK